MHAFPLAQMLRETSSLSEAEVVMRAGALNEIDFERRVASRIRRDPPCGHLPGLICEMSRVGATHITTRRLAEVLGSQGFVEVTASSNRDPGGLWSLHDLERLAGGIAEH